MNLIFEGSTFSHFQEFISISNISMSKALFKCQKLIKQPKRVLTNHVVIWKISKLNKIRNQDMEIDIFMLCFKIKEGFLGQGL